MVKVDVITRDVEMPSGVTAKLSGDLLTVKGPKGELKMRFMHPRVMMKVEGSRVSVHCDNPKRAEMGLCGTWAANVKNMVRGVTKGFQYKMRIIYSHFPIKTSVKGKELVIENFLGERHPRTANILDGVTAKISGDSIILEGNDKQKVGQTASNIEKSTIVKGYDPRVFQDGIYLVSRGE